MKLTHTRPMSLALATAMVLCPPTVGGQGTTGDAPTTRVGQSNRSKSPAAARVIGIIPGAGHMYAGEVGKGIAYLGGSLAILTIGAAVLAADCVRDAFSDEVCTGSSAAENITLGAFFGLWAWSFYDAGRAARRTNAKRGIVASLIIAPTTSAQSGRGITLAVSLTAR